MSIYDLNAYEVIREEDLSDLKSKGILLKHKKSQAKILLFANDDENKVFTIGFRFSEFNACIHGCSILSEHL